MTKCIVTGGAGFIGSHLVDALLARGDDVTVIDMNLGTGNLSSALRHGCRMSDLVIGSGRLQALFDLAQPDIVFHMAARVSVTDSVSDPVRDCNTNVLGALKVLNAAQKAGARRFVNSSSGGAVHGNASIIPTTEHEYPRPMSPYGQAKLAFEGYCNLYSTDEFSTVSLRYSNVYGPRQRPGGEAAVIPAFASCLFSGEPPVVYGSGEQTRDFIHVADVVEANLAAAASSVCGVINVSTGVETTLLDLITRINAAGHQNGLWLPAPEFRPARPGEVQRSCLDPDLARSALGWDPWIELSDGLDDLITTWRS